MDEHTIVKLQRRPDLLWEQLGRSVALLDKARTQAHSLDGVAAAVWLACASPCERTEVVAVVSRDGHDPSVVDDTIESLLDLELLAPVTALDRRTVLRRGLGAVTVGAVLSISLPEPAAALSTGAPAPQLRDKAGWSLTGTQGASLEVVSIDSVTYPGTTPNLQFAVVSIPAQPDVPALNWMPDGSAVFQPFVVADEAGFAFADPSAELTAWSTATELLAVFYTDEPTPQVAGWAYFPSRP